MAGEVVVYVVRLGIDGVMESRGGVAQRRQETTTAASPTDASPQLNVPRKIRTVITKWLLPFLIRVLFHQKNRVLKLHAFTIVDSLPSDIV